jgi:NADPH:quinone reductase-like Zn-dependent oxidoreductase
MDAIGGKSFKQSYSLLRAGGRLVAFGASALVSGEKRSIPTALKTVAQMPRFNLIKQMTASKAVIGLNMLTIWDSKGSLDDYIDPLREWIDAGKIRPVVAQAFPLAEGPAAHRFIIERKNVGKVVLTV